MSTITFRRYADQAAAARYSAGAPFNAVETWLNSDRRPPIVTRTIGGVELTPEMCGSVESSEDEPGYYGTANDSEIGPEIYPAPGAEPWYRNDRGMRDPQQAVKVHQETEQAYVRSLRNIGKAGACAILAAFLSLPAFAAEPCKVNVNAATSAEIQLLARTGEVLAGRIVAGRPLDAEKLDAVKGVGPAWLAVNGPHVAFTGPTTCTEKVASPKVPRVAELAPKL